MSQLIKIACTIDEEYAQHFAVMCTSLFKSNPSAKFQVFLIVDGINPTDEKKLNSLFLKYKQKIDYIKIDVNRFKSFPLSAHASPSNYFRIVLPELMPDEIGKVLYLDSDIVIQNSILELWNLNVSEVALAAWGYANQNKSKQLGLENSKYFNSGVMLINLDYWRRNNITQKILDFINQNPQLLDFWDQDALNATLKREWKEFDEIYNFTANAKTTLNGEKPSIIHFVGMHKPWHSHYDHVYKERYWEYLRNTPYKYAHLKDKIKRILIRIKNELNPDNGRNLKAERTQYNGKLILDGKDANLLIGDKLKESEPFFAGRIGSTELSCLCYYSSIYKFSREAFWKMKENMKLASGFFSNSDHLLNKFAETYIHEELPKVDLLGVWFNKGEEEVVKQYCKPGTEFCQLNGLEPYYFDQPWSKYLEGKIVLVIHPFIESIELQYHKRKSLFMNKEVLPEFELKTLKAVQSIAGNKTNYIDWFEALEDMKLRISQIEFDVAIIGAGAYGFHLGGFVKSLNRTAIHLGGATQILFGIKGLRWDNHPDVSKLYNANWIKPKAAETPAQYKIVERGCYW